MWCKSHPSEWRSLCHEKGAPLSDETSLWTIAEHFSYLNQIANKRLKEAKDKKGIVSEPLIPFIEPSNYIFPVLHFEIGTVNNVLDSLRGFIEDQVEVISAEEKVARNHVIISDVSCTRAKEALSDWNSTGRTIELRAFRLEKVNINQALRARGLSEERRTTLLEEKSEIEGIIDGLVAQQKHM